MFSKLIALLAVLASLLTVVAIAPASAQSSDTFVVNSTGDQADASLNDSVCRTSAGTCTLRAAMEQANFNTGPNRIEFNLSGSGPFNIIPDTTLPILYDTTGGTTIDGYTQPGSAPNTAAQGSNAVIKIDVHPPRYQPYGFRITSPANVIRGLAVGGFYHNIEIYFESADGNKIIGNFIGPGANGEYRPTGATGYGFGVVMSLGPDQNVIGSPAKADRNVLSGNTYKAITIEHGETTDNFIQNNVIGLSADGSSAPLQRDGIDIQWWSNGNLVGGFNPGEGNVISGNQRTTYSWEGGIDLSHNANNNLIVGNYFGTLLDGKTATAYSANTNNIVIKDRPNNNYIAYNVIANAVFDGIASRHNYNFKNVMVGNLVGVGINGSSIGNGSIGIKLNGHNDVLVDNVVANNGNFQIGVVDEWSSNPDTNYDSEATYSEAIHQTTMWNYTLPSIDLGINGTTANDVGDSDDGPNKLLNTPVVDGAGPGIVAGTVCPNCLVEVSLDGKIVVGAPTGNSPLPTVKLDTAQSGGGMGWVGTVKADSSGRWALASNTLVADKKVTVLAVDGSGNTSEALRAVTIPASPNGTVASGVAGSGSPSRARISAPNPPPLPPPYVGQSVRKITGTVTTSTGDPVGNMGVELFTSTADGGRGVWKASVSTSSTGQFTHFPTADGCWVLTFVAPSGKKFVESNSPWYNKRVCLSNGTATANATIYVPNTSNQATINGMVTDGGAGASGINVDVFSSNSSGARLQWTTYATTAADGKFSLELPAGCWAFTYIAPSGRTFSNGSRYLNKSTCVTGGTTTALDAVSLLSNSSSMSASGTVTRNGAGVAGVWTDLFTANADGSRANYLRSVSTNSSGTYRHTITAAGCYVEVLIAPAGQEFIDSNSKYLQRRFCITANQNITRPEAKLRDA